MNDIEILENYIALDRRLRNFKSESDYEKFCEEKCIAIENLIQRNKELEQIEEEHKKENGELRERIKELEKYANWHIEHLTEDIADYIDDDKKANANLIGELKEEREHWKDIIRISNNENTYIDYKNY